MICTFLILLFIIKLRKYTEAYQRGYQVVTFFCLTCYISHNIIKHIFILKKYRLTANRSIKLTAKTCFWHEYFCSFSKTRLWIFIYFFFFLQIKRCKYICEYIIYYTQAYLGEVRQIWRQDACATDTTVDIGFNE